MGKKRRGGPLERLVELLGIEPRRRPQARMRERDGRKRDREDRDRHRGKGDNHQIVVVVVHGHPVQHEAEPPPGVSPLDESLEQLNQALAEPSAADPPPGDNLEETSPIPEGGDL